ncbi:MAG TPA: hypothetical protein PK313_14395 [Myxococcota bacterium]|nr:hypothetical protein [Myxococcota bacterium]
MLLGVVAAGCRGGAEVQQPGAGANPSTPVAQPGAGAGAGAGTTGTTAVATTSEGSAQGAAPEGAGMGQASEQHARDERLKARIPQPKEGTMQKEAPEPLLMEMWAVRPMTRPSGYRILADGKWWRYSDSDYVLDIDPSTGEQRLRMVRIEEGWWDSECVLTADELARLKAVVRTSGVMDLPAETPPSGKGVIGGTDVYFTFEIDGKRHRIHYLEGGDEVPGPIAVLEELASRVVFNSQQRWLRDRGEEHSPLVDF